MHKETDFQSWRSSGLKEGILVENFHKKCTIRWKNKLRHPNDMSVRLLAK